mmetsp:Transcript_27526/g.36083  ORF Transcript_27526/g.36083 Transcript_27526/m.36083 type:complete len:626 (+) Transcript_27526:57-1934(+)
MEVGVESFGTNLRSKSKRATNIVSSVFVILLCIFSERSFGFANEFPSKRKESRCGFLTSYVRPQRLPCSSVFQPNSNLISSNSNNILFKTSGRSLESRKSMVVMHSSIQKEAPLPSTAIDADVVIIGGGIGGLSCGALLAKEGYNIQVFESHTIPGGCAHSFDREGFTFESGPSIYSGFTCQPFNPLKQVLDIIEEEVPMIPYDGWGMLTPQGPFKFTLGPEPFREEIKKRSQDPEQALKEWDELIEKCKEVTNGALGIPPSALRSDQFALLPLLKYFPELVQAASMAKLIQGPSTELMTGVKDKFIIDWLNALAFSLSGLDAEGTMGATLAYTVMDLHRQGSALDYPRGGTDSIIQALVRGIEKRGGKVHLGKHVEEILVEDGKATGIRLRGETIVNANHAVVSNAPIWNTVDLFSDEAIPIEEKKSIKGIPKTQSYLHLHLGIDAKNLDTSKLHPHYTVINQWENITAPLNMMAISIPTLLDPSLAPEGCHIIHAYGAGNEPFDIWEGKQRNSEEYKKLKEERGDALWKAVERLIPDVRDRAKVSMVGSPLTHARFLRREEGTYGPVLDLVKQNFPQPNIIALDNFYCCGDSIFPGIGVPAVAVSGMNVANTLTPVWKHLLRA